MDIKELSSRMFINFFIIFFCIIFIVSIVSQFQGADTIGLNFIFNTAVLSFMIVFAEIVFYSKRELSRLELFARHLICLSLVIVIVSLFMIFMLGVALTEPSDIIGNIGITFVVYTISFVIDYLRTVNSTNQLTKKLTERYK